MVFNEYPQKLPLINIKSSSKLSVCLTLVNDFILQVVDWRATHAGPADAATKDEVPVASVDHAPVNPPPVDPGPVRKGTRLLVSFRLFTPCQSQPAEEEEEDLVQPPQS